MSKLPNPEMISLARESRGLTQGALAAAVGVSQGKVSKYESGMLAVPETELDRIAHHLGYPKAFFSQEDTIHGAGSSCLYHRKRQSMPVRELRLIQAKVNVVRIHPTQSIGLQDAGTVSALG
jgi:transcriptional regulator with XRE-family HTH domain